MTTSRPPRYTTSKQCRACGRSFVLTAPNQLFCTPRCRAEAAVERETRRLELRAALGRLVTEAMRAEDRAA